MPTVYSTTVRVAYCVEIEAPGDGCINWIKTQERLERFAESYGNEDREVKRSAKRVCTVPPSNSLFALAAQAVTNDNEDLPAALPSWTKEDVERIREIYPIFVMNEDEDPDLENMDSFKQGFKVTTSRVLGMIFGRDDHGLRFSWIGHTGDQLVAKLILHHKIPFQDSWSGRPGIEINVVPLTLPPVEPAVAVSMARVLSILGMKAVDEPGWKVVSDHYHDLN
jgi:hypothetical protein